MPIRSTEQVGSQLLLLSAVACLIATLWGCLQIGWGEEFFRFMLRSTARIAVFFFLLAYVARPIRLVSTAASLTLVRHRRHLGLSFALAFAVHVLFIALLYAFTAETVDPATLYAGGGALAMGAFMALTSNNWSIRALGRLWKVLHRFGMHYLWLVFTVTFAGTAGTEFLYLIPTFLLLCAALLRLWAYWLPKQVGANAAAPIAKGHDSRPSMQSSA